MEATNNLKRMKSLFTNTNSVHKFLVLSTDMSPVTHNINYFSCFNEEESCTCHTISLLGSEITDSLLPWEWALPSGLGFESLPLCVILVRSRLNTNMLSVRRFPGLEKRRSLEELDWKLSRSCILIIKVNHIPRTVRKGGVHLGLGSAGTYLGPYGGHKSFHWSSAVCFTEAAAGQL